MVTLNDMNRPQGSALVDLLTQRALADAASQQSQRSQAEDVLIPRYQGKSSLYANIKLRGDLPGGDIPSRATPARRTPITRSVPMTDYINEFYERWDDPKFQTWFMSRTLASGRTSAKSTYEDYLDAWVDIGKVVAQGMYRGTPEQYLEWAATGQKVSADEIRKEIENGEPLIDPATDRPILPTEEQYGADGSTSSQTVNPITTYRSTSSATINREAAYAMVDQLSQSLLGRMATKAEMARARRVMNRMLAANPTVTTTTRDATDPYNVVESTRTRDGMSPADAQAALQMKMQRSSEGTAFTVGNMFEDAMRLLASKEG